MLSCLGVIAASDLLISRLTPPLTVQALLDEAAHAGTGLLALGALGVAFEMPVVLAVLSGSLVIDLDHLPGLLGSHVLDSGTPRPYTHSLGTLAVVAAGALLAPPRARKLLFVATSALAMHFFRDMAEPGGPGVALLWPLSDRAFTLGYAWYAAVLGTLAAIGLTVRRAPFRAARRGSRSTIA
jgi:hypothetical protein